MDLLQLLRKRRNAIDKLKYHKHVEENLGKLWGAMKGGNGQRRAQNLEALLQKDFTKAELKLIKKCFENDLAKLEKILAARKKLEKDYRRLDSLLTSLTEIETLCSSVRPLGEDASKPAKLRAHSVRKVLESEWLEFTK